MNDSMIEAMSQFEIPKCRYRSPRKLRVPVLVRAK